MSEQTVTLLFLFPLIGGAAALILSLFRASLIAALSMVAALFAGAALSLRSVAVGAVDGTAVIVAGGWPEGVGIALRYDGTAAITILLFYMVAALTLLYALGSGERNPLFFGVSGIAVAGMIGVVLSADLFNLFVFFEVLSLSAAFLIAGKRNLPAMQAAFRYLLVATLSIALYLLGIFLLYRSYGELSIAALRGLVEPGGEGRLATRLAGALLFSSVATRVALVPFSGWLPEAHGQAPTAVSALLSGLMLKAGFVALTHLITIFSGLGLEELLLWFGAVSALLGALGALLQEDAKRLLAFSSISQLGYIAAAAGAGAFAGAFYHLLSHAVYKSLLFLIVGGWVYRWGLRNVDSLRARLTSPEARRETRFSRLLLLLGVAAIIGLPPFSAFASKGLMSALMKGSPAYPIIQITGLLTAAALLKLALAGIPRLRPAPGEPGAVERASSPAGDRAGAAIAEAAAAGARWRRRLATLVTGGALVLLFLPTLGLGVFPDRILTEFASLGVLAPEVLSSGVVTSIYTAEKVGQAFLLAAGGALILALMRTSRGRELARRAEAVRIGVDGSMAFVVVGTAVALGLLL